MGCNTKKRKRKLWWRAKFCSVWWDSLTMNIMKTCSLFQLYLLFISKKTQEQKVPSSHLIIISLLGVEWLRVIGIKLALFILSQQSWSSQCFGQTQCFLDVWNPTTVTVFINNSISSYLIGPDMEDPQTREADITILPVF